jgi:hypothetical protein
LIFWKKPFLQLCPKLPNFVQKLHEILGVKFFSPKYNFFSSKVASQKQVCRFNP